MRQLKDQPKIRATGKVRKQTARRAAWQRDIGTNSGRLSNMNSKEGDVRIAGNTLTASDIT
jgi:hypothetical protein